MRSPFKYLLGQTIGRDTRGRTNADSNNLQKCTSGGRSRGCFLELKLIVIHGGVWPQGLGHVERKTGFSLKVQNRQVPPPMKTRLFRMATAENAVQVFAPCHVYLQNNPYNTHFSVTDPFTAVFPAPPHPP